MGVLFYIFGKIRKGMQIRYILAMLSFMVLAQGVVKAQVSDTSMLDEELGVKREKVEKGYWSNGVDAALFQSSIITRPATAGQPARSSELSTLRFSYILNFGTHYNYDFNKHVGLYTGVGIKNIGFIDKIKDSTVKRRVYTIGVPLGIKIGNLKGRKFFFAGGGIDLPFNYKEKDFVTRGHKEKFNEWFSHRTPQFMPYVFAGVSFNPGLVLKFQYYPGNFMNTSYSIDNGTTVVTPYAGYDVHLLLISLGVDIHYRATAMQEQKKKMFTRRVI